jgi:thiamine phosphate synthase YjbQ (UPF0047 family)
MKKRRIMIDIQTSDEISIHELTEYALKLVNNSSLGKATLAIEVKELRR